MSEVSFPLPMSLTQTLNHYSDIARLCGHPTLEAADLAGDMLKSGLKAFGDVVNKSSIGRTRLVFARVAAGRDGACVDFPVRADVDTLSQMVRIARQSKLPVRELGVQAIAYAVADLAGFEIAEPAPAPGTLILG